ncbi:MAG: family 78 glycoside hydrolase catalytic domain [Armatimonadetes bacterium]|nr:family 78 glycoside hydrolase catalytic domain [Armatimonadota bacterium]MDE2205632.1 family 78 glycoside hydrolase catalytic domain [Armatimonadota bacterium]
MYGLPQLDYAGPQLRSLTAYHWHVRAWDERGNTSDVSESARFVTGLIPPRRWHSPWIAATTDTNNTDSPLLRTGFQLRSKPPEAWLAICGLGWFAAEINGKPVTASVLNPGFTRYDKRALYCVMDVANLLHEGENVLAVVLGNGWYNVQTRAVWRFHEAPWRASPRLSAILVDGEGVTLCETGPQWQTRTGPITRNCVYGGETFDARLVDPHWSQPGANPDGWRPALRVPPPGGRLAAQIAPAVTVTQTLPAVELTEPRPGCWLFDFGQVLAGWARLTTEAAPGEGISMEFGERLGDDGTLDNRNIATWVHSEDGAQPFQLDTYIGCGGKQRWEPSFTWHGFRYVQMQGCRRPPKRRDLEARLVHADVEPAGQFECSLPLINQIQHATRAAYLANLVSIPTDCPHREKNGWTGDAHLAAEQALYNFEPTALYRDWIQSFEDEQRPSGELPAIIPTSGWGYRWGNGPAWDSALLLIPWYLWWYRADRKTLERHYAAMKRYVEYLAGVAEGGILSIGLGDWVHPDTDTPVEVTSTAYFAVDADLLSQVAALTGHPADAVRYRKLATSVRAAFCRAFVNHTTGQVANGSQTALSCALYQEMLPRETRGKTAARLVDAVHHAGFHPDCGILGAKYLLNALLDAGHWEIAWRVITQRGYPGWAWWMEQGATTLWESWQGVDSRCHIMFGDISAWFYRALAGITPAAPGFQRFRVAPCCPVELAWVRSRVPTPFGEIHMAWERRSGQVEAELQVPVGTEAEIAIPECRIAESAGGRGESVDGQCLPAGKWRLRWRPSETTTHTFEGVVT